MIIFVATISSCIRSAAKIAWLYVTDRNLLSPNHQPVTHYMYMHEIARMPRNVRSQVKNRLASSRSERGSSAGPTGGEVPGGRVSGD